MALSQIYQAEAGHVITAARWNNEFGNIYTNGTDVAFPVTKAVSLAGWTLTIDSAGVTTLSSTASVAFIFTPGSKAGTPSENGAMANFVAGTFNDTNTAASGTASLWTGVSIRLSALTATNANVVTTRAASLYVEGPPTAGVNQTITTPLALLVDSGNTELDGDLTIITSDSRTNTVDTPVSITSTTSGSPAAGIGTGIVFQAESEDENPSNVGQAEFAFSDVGAGTEDSYFQILLRVAGAALTACWRFVATGAFKGIFTHANTADRTYTLPDRNFTFGAGDFFRGPSSTGASSTQAHEGTVTISASQALSGVHFYTNFTLDAGDTLTVGNDEDRLIICATETITINGTIDAVGAGSTAGGSSGGNGQSGFTQAGGGGGAGDTGNDGGDGGAALIHGVIRRNGGSGGTGGGSDGTTPAVLNTDALSISSPFSILGGGGGGGGGNGTAGSGGAGGRGGGSIVLIAPTVILGASSTLDTRGAAGSGPSVSTTSGGGAGGGAGNVYIFCQSYTDSGCTFTLTGGAGAVSGGTGGSGFPGAAGVRQINIYA